ncbi:MAG: hypothetical protein Wins2KO_00600 [Winogradskyella sp.]
MKESLYKLIELFVLFVIIPVTLVINLSIRLKIGIALIGLIYTVVLLVRNLKMNFRISKQIEWLKFFKHLSVKFLVLILLTTFYVYVYNRENLFGVISKDPKVWLFFSFVYVFCSVYPQEVIYRTFFFMRYKALFKNETMLILVNAALFSLAHLFFRNALVMILTFLGGIVFALTYHKTKSTLLVAIEHAIYGCWLYTVGMGEMLGFPT